MSSIQNLEIEVTELFKKKEYSKVIFQITSETKDEERTAFLCNLLGLSRITNNKKNTEVTTTEINITLNQIKKKVYFWQTGLIITIILVTISIGTNIGTIIWLLPKNSSSNNPEPKPSKTSIPKVSPNSKTIPSINPQPKAFLIKK